MRRYRSEVINIIDSETCDRCGRTDNNELEMQEYLAIDFIGGYKSVFGDMEKYTGDICQRCVKALLGNYLKKVEKKYSEQDNIDFLLETDKKTKNVKGGGSQF